MVGGLPWPAWPVRQPRSWRLIDCFASPLTAWLRCRERLALFYTTPPPFARGSYDAPPAAACQTDFNPRDRSGIADHTDICRNDRPGGPRYAPFGDAPGQFPVRPRRRYTKPSRSRDKLAVLVLNEHTDRYLKAKDAAYTCNRHRSWRPTLTGPAIFNTTCSSDSRRLLIVTALGPSVDPVEVHASPHDLADIQTNCSRPRTRKSGRSERRRYDWLFPRRFANRVERPNCWFVSAYMDPWGATPLRISTLVNRCRTETSHCGRREPASAALPAVLGRAGHGGRLRRPILTQADPAQAKDRRRPIDIALRRSVNGVPATTCGPTSDRSVPPRQTPTRAASAQRRGELRGDRKSKAAVEITS